MTFLTSNFRYIEADTLISYSLINNGTLKPHFPVLPEDSVFNKIGPCLTLVSQEQRAQIFKK